MNREELIEDPRFITNELRAKNYVPDLQEIMRDYVKDFTKKKWKK